MPGTVLPSVIRTWIPLLVGWLLSLPLVAWILDLLQVPQSDRTTWLARGVTAAITGLYYLLARLIEQRFPQLGSVLVSFGIAKAPVYHDPDTGDQVHDVTTLPRQDAEQALEEADLFQPDNATGPNAVTAHPDAGDVTIQEIFFALGALAFLVYIAVAAYTHLH